jgi:hypothetical protein
VARAGRVSRAREQLAQARVADRARDANQSLTGQRGPSGAVRWLILLSCPVYSDGADPTPSVHTGQFDMRQIKVRWSDLGSPTQPGTYRCGLDMVEVTPGDIKLANENPDAVFTAIHPDFYSEETPYLLTGVEFPSSNRM